MEKGKEKKSFSEKMRIYSQIQKIEKEIKERNLLVEETSDNNSRCVIVGEISCLQKELTSLNYY